MRNHKYHSIPIINHRSFSLTHSVNNMDEITTHQDPHDGKEHTFTDSLFRCSNNNGCGGAIDLTNGGNLIIQRCIFDTCSCSERGGAVSYRGDGKCTQENNLYTHCSSRVAGGAFNSFFEWHLPTHYQKACRYINSRSPYYAHMGIEYTPQSAISSNVFIRGTSSGTDSSWVGTVVNIHVQGSVMYSNCLFAEGEGYITGGLSFVGKNTSRETTVAVKFCFFLNNLNTNGLPCDIYFDGNTTSSVGLHSIIHSFAATPGGTVYIQNNPSQGQDWFLHDHICFISSIIDSNHAISTIRRCMHNILWSRSLQTSLIPLRVIFTRVSQIKQQSPLFLLILPSVNV